MGAIAFPFIKHTYKYFSERFACWVLGDEQRNRWLGPPRPVEAEDETEEEEMEEDRTISAHAQDMTIGCLKVVVYPWLGAAVGDWLATLKPLRAVLPVGPSIAELGLPGFIKPTVGDDVYWQQYTSWVFRESDPRWCVQTVLL
jgi:hypothetical protein